jgi:hypothetical protein
MLPAVWRSAAPQRPALSAIGVAVRYGRGPCATLHPMPVARKVARLLRDLETYVSGQSDLIIDYATARRHEEPISTATTESTVQWLLHRRMHAQQQMRWSPRGAHLMLNVRTSAGGACCASRHIGRRPGPALPQMQPAGRGQGRRLPHLPSLRMVKMWLKWLVRCQAATAVC